MAQANVASTENSVSSRLVALANSIAGATSLRTLIADVVETCADTFAADAVRLFVQKNGQGLVGQASFPVSTPLDVNPALQESLTTSEPLVLKGKALKAYASYDHAGSVLLMPLCVDQETIGVLELQSKLVHAWKAETVALIRLLASQLGLAIANVQLRQQSKKRDEQIETLNDIAATVTSSLDPREVYKLVVQKINTYFQVEAGSLLLLDEQTRELVFVMTLEAGEEKLAGVRVPPGQGLVGEAIRTRRPVVVTDAQTDPRFYKKVSEDVGFVTRTVLCVPMLVKGREIGVIQLLNKADGVFNDDDSQRLSAMANTIAVAIDNANLFQQVTQNRNSLEAILNSTADGILTIDNNDVVVTANPMMEHLFGLVWHKLRGQSGASILAYIANITRPISDSPNGNGDVTELEILKPSNGFVRQITLPVFDVNNAIIGKLIVFHDISEERELARLRDDYTGMLVHDLRAPLTAIINGLTMVRRGFAGEVNPQQRELLDLANNSSQDMVGMINTLLDISKMEAGEVVLNRTPCSAYEIVDKAVERLLPSAKSANISINLDMALNLPIIDADQDKLVRVLQNLLDNALKFTPLDGEVTIQVRQVTDETTGPAICWSVIDAGPGIPPEYLSRIFNKFVQVGQQRKGTGLGLAFAKLTSEAHGGRIWVESEPRKGSTFSFTIPYTTTH